MVNNTELKIALFFYPGGGSLKMKNISVFLSILLTLVLLSANLSAQSDIARETRSVKLLNLSQQLKTRDQADKMRAMRAADKMGIASRRVLSNGRILELQRIVPGIGPIFYVTYNVDAADTVSTDEVWPGGSAGLNLDGSGMVMGEWDGGAVYSDHWDFDSRLTQADFDLEQLVSGHATHVAGTLIGSGTGLDPRSRGMAYAAQLDAYDWNSDTAEMASAAASGLLVSNHSYGIAAGWLYMGPVEPPDTTWWWIGGSGQEDPNFGYYDSESALWDQIALDAPYYLIVKAAGNDRTDVGPSLGEEYTVIDQSGDFVEYAIADGSHDPDCAPAGYDCIASASTAKNVLTVGAVDDIYDGYSVFSGPSSVTMASFSSWGPTDDGRIKPDIVGNGMFLISAWTTNEFSYAAAAGTSMATPNVSGSLLLLQQHYANQNPGNYMRATTLKALAIHTADEAGEADGPDYEFGWGLLNAKSAAAVISDDGTAHQIIEDNLAENLGGDAVNTVEIVVTEVDALVTATLVWADPPGPVTVPQILNDNSSKLVNNLDLQITRGGEVHLPWVLNPEFPAQAASRGINVLDNVEQVVIDGGTPGSYFVEVRHEQGAIVGDSQDYSLIISSVRRPSTVKVTQIDEDFSSGSLPAGWELVTTSGVPWEIRSSQPGTRYENQTGGSGHYAMADANYRNSMNSKLRSPTLDLTDSDAVVLKFKSYWQPDESEKINVQYSTDNGGTWNNIWPDLGISAFVSNIDTDISSIAAGQSSFAFQFIFDSNSINVNVGDRWQVDDVVLDTFGGTPGDDLPGPSRSPDPPDGATGLPVSTSLSWIAGSQAASHDVFMGLSPSLNSGDFQGNYTGTVFGPESLEHGTTYYWRVDEVNAEGKTEGLVWSFTTQDTGPVPPGQASTPVPADGTSGHGLSIDLNWTAGALASSHDVYFGTNPVPGPGEFQGNQAGTTFDPGSLASAMTYYWRIDEVNDDGTTTGPIWGFTTEPPAQSTELHLSNMTPSSIPGSRDKWTASVQVEVTDGAGTAMQNVQVDGSWSNGARGGGSCVTNSIGICTVEKASLKSNVASVVFTVTGLVATGYTYDDTANEVDSAITVLKDGGTADRDPVAENDSYETLINTPISDNVMSNDDPGTASASVSSYDANSTAGGTVSMAVNGDFTYIPNAGYAGTDTFTYTITDSNDVSDSAIVTITISKAPTGFNLTAVARRSKGIWFVDLGWNGGLGTGQVSISHDAAGVIAPATDNDGSFTHELGKKVGGTHTYTVCELDSGGTCASDSVQF